MARRESRVESQGPNSLVGRIEAIGGACEKHVNNGHRGDPDRLCSFPWGYHCLVETKWAPDVEPEPHQKRRHAFWRKRGMPVFVAGDSVGIQRVIDAALDAKNLAEIGVGFFAFRPEENACKGSGFG